MARGRAGSCCGKANEDTKADLNTITAIKIFLHLVDTNAPVKKYQMQFGWSRVTLNNKLSQVNMYRRTYLCAMRIKKLIKIADIESVSKEITRLRSLMWKDGPLNEV